MKVDTNERLTRHSNENDLYIPFVNTNIAENSFFYQGPNIWNGLPCNVQECTTVENFKSKAKEFFLQRL